MIKKCTVELSRSEVSAIIACLDAEIRSLEESRCERTIKHLESVMKTVADAWRRAEQENGD